MGGPPRKSGDAIGLAAREKQWSRREGAAGPPTGNVVVQVRVNGQEAKGLAEREIRNDVEGQILDLAGKIKDAAFGDIALVEEIDKNPRTFWLMRSSTFATSLSE
jgi:hypothetical protein